MDYARILRSKNAGAFVLTIDVIFKDQQAYDHVTRSAALDAQIIANRYQVPSEDVRIIAYPQVLAIKVTMPRLVGSGDLADSDVYGSQQHVPLMYLPVTTTGTA
ncbi:DUF4387 domain-containing protein [Orrella marina]|uniref:DUF4387 domain-containing protein n=2 Tax=Orrella marina TaxID=2163011 RepID=A0A2R4XM06_9BURK|nr:DUF4387 domain-containing protein [Orrella marina]